MITLLINKLKLFKSSGVPKRKQNLTKFGLCSHFIVLSFVQCIVVLNVHSKLKYISMEVNDSQKVSNYNDRRRKERENIGLIGVSEVWEKSPPQPVNE